VKPYPHTYTARAISPSIGSVTVTSTELPAIETNSPPDFDGPEGFWSPETLLTGAVADCFVLTFRAVARASGLAWQRLDCQVDGVLERIDGVAQFSGFMTRATLTVAVGTDAEKATRLLERAEKGCLIANSLRGTRALEAKVIEAAP
jgi:organic hydroperoxide reductase OsmC/OhrA